MARARNIKPGFFKNEDLSDLGPLAQLLFAGLWCLADRQGRLEDRPRFIKSEIFPYYDSDVNGELTKLERLGFVRRYKVNGMAYIVIDKFKKHQSPHSTEKASELPGEDEADPSAPCQIRTTDDNSESTMDSRKDNGGNPPDSLIHRFTDSLIPESTPAASQPTPAPKSKRKAKEPKTRIAENFGVSERVAQWAEKNGHTRLAEHLDAFSRKCRAKGYEYVNWDDAFMEAIRADWAGLGSGRSPPSGKTGKFDPVAFVNRNRPAENHERTDNIIDV